MGPLALLALCSVPQDGLAKYGLKPNVEIVAVDGKATIAEGETIELFGLTDLANPVGRVVDLQGSAVSKALEEYFWKVLDDRPPTPTGEHLADGRGSQEYVRVMFSRDKDERTFAMAFRLSPSLSRALDVDAESGKRFWPLLSRTRKPMPEDKEKWVGEGRILRPLFAKGEDTSTFSFRLEVPGGAWTNLCEFTFTGDTKLMDGEIASMQRYQNLTDFKEVNGERKIVDYKGYYFTLTLPDVLRDLELEIVTNDPASDALMLPGPPTHIRGEQQGPEFTGKDLFLVYGLRAGGANRKFTLRARPKRTVLFKGIPYKKGD